jgi:hypothetical protein
MPLPKQFAVEFLELVQPFYVSQSNISNDIARLAAQTVTKIGSIAILKLENGDEEFFVPDPPSPDVQGFELQEQHKKQLRALLDGPGIKVLLLSELT